jgi:hypothetical protein
MKRTEVPSASISFTVGTNNAILVNRSTNTQIAEYDPELGSCVMKSTDMEAHGLDGTGSGCNKPYGL